MKWYVVYRGRCLGVYTSWSECNEQILCYEGNSHESFDNRETAEYHYNQYLLTQKRKTDECNGASKTRLSWFSGLKNFIILFQFVIIVVLLFIIWCMHADHFVV